MIQMHIVQWIIRREADGFTKTIDVDVKGDRSFIDYYYFDGGNMDCDCNRAGYYEDDSNHDCGADAYTTVAVIDTKGNRYVNDPNNAL